MDASELTRKNKTIANWVNFRAFNQTQASCIVNCGATVSSCIIRYGSYDMRDQIREGRANCGCSTITCYVTGTKTS